MRATWAREEAKNLSLSDLSSAHWEPPLNIPIGPITLPHNSYYTDSLTPSGLPLGLGVFTYTHTNT